jgi:hypothetical protein
VYRGELGDEGDRAATLRAEIAALESKLATARADSDKLALEERRGLRRRLSPLLRWWGILVLVFAFSFGMLISIAARGLDAPRKDPCQYLKGIPITVPAR